MPPQSFILATLTFGLLAGTSQFTQNSKPKSSGEKSVAASDAGRGKYLVESVAMCGTCHTPRDSSGNLDQSRWLQGASVPYMAA